MFQIVNLIKQQWLVISTLILIVITALSLTPLAHLPAVPGNDKVHHLFSYALLFFPIAYAKPKHWLWIAVLFLLWSGAIELIQPYVNRYGEWSDMLANGLGLFCGYILALFSKQILKK